MPTEYNITKIQLPNGDECLINRVKYIDITKSGDTYSLPSGTTYTSIKALIDADYLCIVRVDSPNNETDGKVHLYLCNYLPTDSSSPDPEWDTGLFFQSRDYSGEFYQVKIFTDNSVNFSIGGSGGGILNTDITSSQSVNTSESLSGTVKLHKISKTGYYSDLINRPTIPTNSDFSLSGLSDTIISSLSNGEILTYNSTTGKWKNESLSKGTNTGTGNVVTDLNVTGHQITLTKGITTAEYVVFTYNRDNDSYTCSKSIADLLTGSESGILYYTTVPFYGDLYIIVPAVMYFRDADANVDDASEFIFGIQNGATSIGYIGTIVNSADHWELQMSNMSYNSLDDLPTIPSSDSDLTNDRYVRHDTNSQGLSAEEKSNARTNIGAGTSNFSGSYNDLSNKPTIPAAQVNSDWNAASGVAQILNKPSIPTNSDFALAGLNDVYQFDMTITVVNGGESIVISNASATPAQVWEKLLGGFKVLCNVSYVDSTNSKTYSFKLPVDHDCTIKVPFVSDGTPLFYLFFTVCNDSYDWSSWAVNMADSDIVASPILSRGLSYSELIKLQSVEEGAKNNVVYCTWDGSTLSADVKDLYEAVNNNKIVICKATNLSDYYASDGVYCQLTRISYYNETSTGAGDDGGFIEFVGKYSDTNDDHDRVYCIEGNKDSSSSWSFSGRDLFYIDYLQNAITNRHSHSNKTILDKIPSSLGTQGQVLTVGSGSTLSFANVPTELPTTTGNAGKVLKVNSGATGVEWGNDSDEKLAIAQVNEYESSPAYYRPILSEENSDSAHTRQYNTDFYLETTGNDIDGNKTILHIGDYYEGALQIYGTTHALRVADGSDIYAFSFPSGGGTIARTSDIPAIPSISGNAGKVLTVNSDATAMGWETPSGGTTVSGNNDGTYWTDITIGSDTYDIPSSGNVYYLDFSGSDLGPWSGNRTISFISTIKREYAKVTVSADLNLTISSSNTFENYILFYNSTSSDIDVTIAGVNNLSSSSIIVPSDGITVSAGKYLEVSVYASMSRAVITKSGDLE